MLAKAKCDMCTKTIEHRMWWSIKIIVLNHSIFCCHHILNTNLFMACYIDEVMISTSPNGLYCRWIYASYLSLYWYLPLQQQQRSNASLLNFKNLEEAIVVLLTLRYTQSSKMCLHIYVLTIVYSVKTAALWTTTTRSTSVNWLLKPVGKLRKIPISLSQQPPSPVSHSQWAPVFGGFRLLK